MALLLALGALHDVLDAARPKALPDSVRPPRLEEAERPAPAPASGNVPGSAAALDLNRASAAELDGLPGIGPVLAARIVEYRRLHGGFRRVEELRGVTGIGPRLFERLRGRVVVGPEAPTGHRSPAGTRNLQ